jgi:hypothetical protein
LREFFSFCGPISRLVLDRDPHAPGSQFSLVVFTEEHAANTAQLLSNAAIADKPITVTPYLSPEERAGAATSANAAAADSSSDSASGHKSATAVIAGLAAAGLIKGSDLVHTLGSRASELDTRVGARDKAKYAASIANAKIQSFDEAYRVSQTLDHVRMTADAGIKRIDDAYGLSAKGKAVTEKAHEVAGKVMQVPQVKAGVELFAMLGHLAAGAVKKVADQVRTEVARQNGQPNPHSQYSASAQDAQSGQAQHNAYEDLE